MADLGKLAKLDPRTVWADEARNFTPWLAKNLDALGEALGLDLEFQSQEERAGDFLVDIVAKDLGTGRPIVIENQLADTDHRHLGQIITYASALDAAAVVWVTPRFREEHRQALDWLNQHTDSDTDFFGVVLEVLRIDDSKPAYSFRPVAFPNEWRKDRIRSRRGAASSRSEAYLEFLQGLMDELREKHQFTNARQALPQNWYSFSSGVRGIQYSASFAHGSRARAEVYIDTGSEEENKQIFDTLSAERSSLEQSFGEPLEWERLDDRRASRIAIYRPADVLQDPESLPEIRQWFVDRLLRFKSVFGPRVANLVL